MLSSKIYTREDLRQKFVDYDRDYYSYQGYQAIIDYFDEFENDVELDVIGLCCDFNEETKEEIMSNYNIEEEEFERYMNDNTWMVETETDTYLYIAF